VSGVGDVLIAVLIFAGIAVEIVCCVGVLVMRGVYARLHYTAPAGLGAVLLAAAVLLREGFSLIGDNALLVAGFVVITSPVLTHVTARAARIREFGRVSADDGSSGQP
jgi:multisubunit Na+/H+ antiporter MnhG subunit